MDQEQKKQLITYLSEFVTANKLEKMEAALKNRTRHVTAVLEDVYQAHNFSAAIRSAECFGVQDVHVIEQKNRFKVNIGISKGATNWVTVHRHNSQESNNVKACFDSLRKKGYWIVATSPHAQAYELNELPLDKKIALVFGTEEAGISDYVKENADASMVIPMQGFTESFNISVSVALCLYDITTRLRKSSLDWKLTEEDMDDVRLEWIRSIVRGSDHLEKRFLSSLALEG